MCGCKIGSMKKHRKTRKTRRASVRGINTKDAGSLLTGGVLPGALGAIALKWAVDKFLPAEYAPQSNYVIGGLGVLLALTMKNPMAKAAGLGAAVVAGANIGQDLVDGQDPTGGRVGLLAPGVPSVRIAGGAPANSVPNQFTTVPRWSPFNTGGVITQ